MFTVLLLFICFALSNAAPNPNCTLEGPCGCVFGDGMAINLGGFKSIHAGKPYLDTTSSQGDIYRYYPCGLDRTWRVNCATGSTMCQYSIGDDEYYSIGQSHQYRILEAVSAGDNSYLKIEYRGGSFAPVLQELRRTRVTIRCGGGDDVLTFIEENPTTVYHLDFTTSMACPGFNGEVVNTAYSVNTMGLSIYSIVLMLFLLTLA